MNKAIEKKVNLAFPFLFLGLIAVAVYCFLFLEPDSIAELKAAKPIKVSGTVTSKDDGQRISVKSAGLPKAGDMVDVDRQAYGSVATGDVVCIQYKSVSNNPQVEVEFVSQGECQK